MRASAAICVSVLPLRAFAASRRSTVCCLVRGVGGEGGEGEREGVEPRPAGSRWVVSAMVKRGACPASRPRPVMDEKGPQSAPVRSHSLTGSARADAVHNGTVHPPSTHVGTTGVTDRDTRKTTQPSSLLPAPQAAQTHAETVAASRARPRCEIPPRCLPARICIHPRHNSETRRGHPRGGHRGSAGPSMPQPARERHTAWPGKAEPPPRPPPLVTSFESAAKAAASRPVSRPQRPLAAHGRLGGCASKNRREGHCRGSARRQPGWGEAEGGHHQRTTTLG